MSRYEYCKKGDIVTYTGDLSYAFDWATSDLMKIRLKVGVRYTIKQITDYTGLPCYEFEGLIGYYPCLSFSLNYSEKYGLK